MKLEIEEKTISETTQCKCNFKCLNNDLDWCCEVERSDNKLIISTKCRGSKYCQYKKFIGFSTFSCICPTRMAISDKQAR